MKKPKKTLPNCCKDPSQRNNNNSYHRFLFTLERACLSNRQHMRQNPRRPRRAFRNMRQCVMFLVVKVLQVHILLKDCSDNGRRRSPYWSYAKMLQTWEFLCTLVQIPYLSYIHRFNHLVRCERRTSGVDSFQLFLCRLLMRWC